MAQNWPLFKSGSQFWACSPLFALGYQQSRWSYPSETRVREIANRFRQERIPADAIYLDIEYQDANRPFTIDRAKFPHFEQMVHDLGAQGFKVIAITDSTSRATSIAVRVLASLGERWL